MVWIEKGDDRVELYRQDYPDGWVAIIARNRDESKWVWGVYMKGELGYYDVGNAVSREDAMQRAEISRTKHSAMTPPRRAGKQSTLRVESYRRPR